MIGSNGQQIAWNKGNGEYAKKLGFGKWMIGKKHSFDTIQKMKGKIPWNKGKTGVMPPKTEKWHIAMKKRSGQNNSFYKHGLSGTLEYQASLANKRRARIRKSGGYFTAKEFLKLKNKYDNVCLACKKKIQLVADHVIPLSCGGLNTIKNIQPLCRMCNSKKYTKTTDFRKLWKIQK